MKILIQNLNIHASKNGLLKLFLKFGKVVNVEIGAEISGRPLGYGFVRMNEADGKNAINELNNLNFMNQFLEVYEINNNNLKQ